ncbi:hypothetical protein B5801_03850 [Gilliamella apicola]|nr:hypothetical protein B5803_09315 [Gilliamella apicola]ORF52245.1 hypothetical protein B5802_10170 [Gilliamella apicola]ORF61570.1 hypothetical protein B5801_03850 [Gilliamella apicola]
MLSDWMNTLMHYNRFQSSQIVLYQLMPSFCNFHHEYMGFKLEKNLLATMLSQPFIFRQTLFLINIAIINV